MPVAWLDHDGRQLFVSVAVLTVSQAMSAQEGRQPGPPPQTFKALVDTGAMNTCITSAAARKIGIRPIGKVPIQGVGGVSYHNNYLFHVGFPVRETAIAAREAPSSPPPATTRLYVLQVPIQGAELSPGPHGFDVLLGMDVIGHGSLVVQGNGTFSWAW